MAPIRPRASRVTSVSLLVAHRDDAKRLRIGRRPVGFRMEERADHRERDAQQDQRDEILDDDLADQRRSVEQEHGAGKGKRRDRTEP